MKFLKDKVLLIIMILIVNFTQFNNNSSVYIILLGILFISLISYFDKPKQKIAILLIYIFICFFIKDLIIFTPIFIYEMFLNKYKPILTFLLLPILINNYDYKYILLILLFTILGIYLKKKTQNELNLEYDYISDFDKNTEKNNNLAKRNKELLNKQNYEINIATLNERNRIAMEIHDNVGHLLSSSLIQLGAVKTVTKDENIKTNLNTLIDTLTSAMNSIRNSIHGIHEDTLDLELQIYSLVTNFPLKKISLNYSIVNNPSKDISHAIISITKEALSNIAKHSDATLVKLVYNEHPSLYQFIIFDNGSKKENSKDVGIGLQNMENRIYNLNGNILISYENGFKIFITIPKGDK